MAKIRPLLASAVVLAAAAGSAGPLLAARLEQDYVVSLQHDVVTIGVDAVAPTGSLVGGRFALEAGSAFALHRTVAAGDLTAHGAAVLPSYVTQVVASIGRNGRLSGAISGNATATASAGIRSEFVLRAKVGKSPAFTLVQVPNEIGVAHTYRASGPASTSFIAFTNRPWTFGTVAATGLTGDGLPLPDARAAGGVSVTAQGNTILTLVSLSRVRAGGTLRFTGAPLSRLTLVYAPEPGPIASWAGAALGGAGLGLRRASRRARRRSRSSRERGARSRAE